MSKIEIVTDTLNNILGFIGITPVVKIEEDADKNIGVVIEGENLNFLIGYRGESLDAVQHLLSLVLFRKTNEPSHVIVDINGYRTQKVEKIEDITKNFIDRVRFSQKDVEMPIMNPSERRLVHTFVANYTDITSESIGEGAQRRVVLKLKS